MTAVASAAILTAWFALVIVTTWALERRPRRPSRLLGEAYARGRHPSGGRRR